MQYRPLGNTGFSISALGFGAFKIGRNQQIKYSQPYDLPDDNTTERLLNSILDLGINHIDTAPAYGISEERVGQFLTHRRSEFLLSTKIGETFENGRSTYDFSRDSLETSIERSLCRLKTDVLDVVLIHSNQDEEEILTQTDTIEVLQEAKQAGKIRWIGLSGKTQAGAESALAWADVLMLEYHMEDRSHESLIQEASQQGIGVIVKKGLASGHLPPEEAISFVLSHSGVSNLVVGGLNLDHIQTNWQTAASIPIRPAA
ncbi:MAG: aldo/keto reductase [Planctomycetes bacterium]|nr:aldo/keto reductase [Planctomycetota bacterium]MCH9725691.1 aldo/keto reductase [Planctomycetota bacterium]MCH9777746.1 aldo/keto reductase [Planctomycetota bacterium]MCH9791198.1 aldo/keto reductase [Planctomycetota bacterium]MDF1745847.1 aldo/keto reductase [Gimesia sp.]